MAERAKTVLEIAGASKSFPGVRALDAVTFDVLAGEVHGLVGENGAGKSTLMAIASGALIPDAGSVAVDGVATSGDPQAARALGLAIVRQEPALMPDLTVAENLYLGVPASLRPAVSDLTRWADECLRIWNENAPVKVSDRVDTLNPEQRFIVEIVKAFANNPKVLVLDEPTEHLAAQDVDRLFERIRRLTAAGGCVVYISHRIREVQRIADRLTVLRDGRSQGTFDARALNEDQIVELIVGVSLDREFPAKASNVSGEALKVENLSGPGFANVGVTVRRGEILGLAGISDNGQHEFMRALAGTQQVPRRGIRRQPPHQHNIVEERAPRRYRLSARRSPSGGHISRPVGAREFLDSLDRCRCGRWNRQPAPGSAARGTSDPFPCGEDTGQFDADRFALGRQSAEGRPVQRPRHQPVGSFGR